MIARPVIESFVAFTTGKSQDTVRHHSTLHLVQSSNEKTKFFIQCFFKIEKKEKEWKKKKEKKENPISGPRSPQ